MNISALNLRKRGIVLVGTAIVILGFSSCSRDEAEQAPQQPIAVRVIAPDIANLAQTISYVGTVRGSQEVRVNARIPGTVEVLPRAVGAPVTSGQLVAAISAPELAASIDRVQAEREYWCQRHEEDVRLVESGALPAEQANASQRACRSASAALAEAEAQIAKTREVAPVSGRILSWLIEPGQHVLPGQGLVLIGSSGAELRVEVIDEDLQRGIEIGTPVTVHASGGETVRSRVTEIAPLASQNARTFTVTVPLSEIRSDDFRVGSSMAADFTLASCSDCVAIPTEALHRIGNGTYVYLIRDGRAHLTAVEPGIRDRGLVQVSFDWNGDDRVAISNLESLADGVPVFAVEVEGDAR